MVEHRTVAPDVAGSIPVTHPIFSILETTMSRKTVIVVPGALLLTVGPNGKCHTEFC